MKRVLFIAYFFPPLGGGGVQRSLKFVRYLPEHGWMPIVLTARGGAYWILDPSLEAEVPSGVEVRRTFSPDGPWVTRALRRRRSDRTSEHVAPASSTTTRTARDATLLRRLSSWFLVPDSYRPWKPFALREARRILRDIEVDLVFSTASPETAHLIAGDLARETGLPWVADFRDPWTHRIVFDPPSRLHASWQRRLERSVLAAASHVVVTADETRDDFLALYPHLGRERFTVVPNGYDLEDFEGDGGEPGWDRFRLRYVGQLTAGRTVAPLLRVLERFVEIAPGARDRTEVALIGPRETENDRLVRASPVADLISLRPPLPHREAVRALSDAHVVLLVENLGPRGELIAQGKLYECLYAERPILAIVPHGAVARLVGAFHAGCAATGDEIESAAAYLVDAFEAWRSRRLLAHARRPDLARFERRALTRDLATLFDRVTAG